MLLYYASIFILGYFVFWFLTSTLVASSFRPPPELRKKRVILLIGHPDDEAMFFAPSLIALASPANHNQVKIVCLSTGNAIGEGEVRRGELLNSACRLGICQEDVFIVDDPRFQDGPGNDWKKEDIADFLSQRFSPQAISNPTANATTTTFSSTLQQRPQPKQQREEDREAACTSNIGPPRTSTVSIDTIVTFDSHGISTHPNHCACYHGSIEFLRNLTHTNDSPCPVTLYTLTSISLLRKYTSVLDAPISILLSRLNILRRNRGMATGQEDRAIFVSGFRDYARAFGAMVLAHKTQMLWFRWGWIVSGRYMVVNDLKREKLGP